MDVGAKVLGVSAFYHDSAAALAVDGELIFAAQEERFTGYGVIVNTSFNVRGEPIVLTPEDSYKCFMRTEMDFLVIGDYVFDKAKQPKWQEEKNWREEYGLD